MGSAKALKLILVTVLFCLFATCPIAFANLEQVKNYKAAFPDEGKPKCAACHVAKLPKKEEGKHDWNEYGKKILEAKKELNKEKVDEEVLKKVGKNEAAEAE